METGVSSRVLDLPQLLAQFCCAKWCQSLRTSQPRGIGLGFIPGLCWCARWGMVPVGTGPSLPDFPPSAKINQEHLIPAQLKPNSLPRASAQLGTTSRPLRTAFAAAPRARCPPPCPRPSSIFELPWAPHCSPVQPRCRQRAAAAQELPAGSVPRPFSTLFRCFSSAARV